MWITSPPEFPLTKRGVNGKFLPKPSFSIYDIRIQKQISRSFGKFFPQKIVLLKLRPHCSTTCLNTWRAELKKKNVFSILEKVGRAQIRKARNVFLGLPSEARDGGRTIRAYEAVSIHHALRACDIICFGNRF